MQAAKTSDPLAARVSDVLTDFVEWLDRYGEKSWDFQSFFAGPVGGRARAEGTRSRRTDPTDTHPRRDRDFRSL